MTPLNGQQKQLLLDYAFGMTSVAESRQAEGLLESNEEAARIHLTLKTTLSPLDMWEIEACPDELADATVRRLTELSTEEAVQQRLSSLLTEEETRRKVIHFPSWRTFGNLAAVAAAALLVVIPALGFGRQKHLENRCQGQLKGIYAGMANYVNDYDGKLPHVAMAAGAPWWKVGYQGQENESNTRHVWLLVRAGYVDSHDFVCPASSNGCLEHIGAQQAAQYNDFPSRKHVQFSMRMCCPQFAQMTLGQRRAILADLNPLSERLPAPSECTGPLSIRLCKELLRNSPNHNRHGQNVLFCDGSVEFTTKRCTRLSDDDIYTLNQMSDGCEICGTETPATIDDAFLVP